MIPPRLVRLCRAVADARVDRPARKHDTFTCSAVSNAPWPAACFKSGTKSKSNQVVGNEQLGHAQSHRTYKCRCRKGCCLHPFLGGMEEEGVDWPASPLSFSDDRHSPATISNGISAQAVYTEKASAEREIAARLAPPIGPIWGLPRKTAKSDGTAPTGRGHYGSTGVWSREVGRSES